MFTKEQMLKALKESTEDQQKVFNESWIKHYLLSTVLGNIRTINFNNN